MKALVSHTSSDLIMKARRSESDSFNKKPTSLLYSLVHDCRASGVIAISQVLRIVRYWATNIVFTMKYVQDVVSLWAHLLARIININVMFQQPATFQGHIQE